MIARAPLFIVGLALAHGALSSSAAAELQPGLHEFELTSSGLTRTYQVYVPSSYDGQSGVPLVLDLHGFGKGSGFQRLVSGWQQKAEDEGFVAAWSQVEGGCRC